MDLVTIIYLGDVVDRIAGFLSLLGGSMIIISIFLILAMFEFDWRPQISHVVIYFATAILLILISILIPSKQTIYTIAAVKYGEQVIKTPEAREVGEKVYKILNQKLDEVLKEK